MTNDRDWEFKEEVKQPIGYIIGKYVVLCFVRFAAGFSFVSGCMTAVYIFGKYHWFGF